MFFFVKTNNNLIIYSWALFHMSEVGILFDCQTNYTFFNEKDLGIKINHKFVFALGEPRKKFNFFKNSNTNKVDIFENSSIQDTLCNAVVCRVQVFF